MWRDITDAMKGDRERQKGNKRNNSGLKKNLD